MMYHKHTKIPRVINNINVLMKAYKHPTLIITLEYTPQSHRSIHSRPFQKSRLEELLKQENTTLTRSWQFHIGVNDVKVKTEILY